MRIGYVYTNKPDWPKSLWVRNALERLGHEVRQVTTHDELRSADAESDLILFQHKNAGLHPSAVVEIAATRKAFWAQWWFDLILNAPGKSLTEQHQFIGNSRMMRAMDAVFVKESAEIHQFQDAGVNAIYLDQGAPEELQCIEDRPKRWDFILWGQASSGYWERNQDAVSLAKAGYRVLWVSGDSIPPGIEHFPWCHPTQLWRLCSQAHAVLSVDARNDVAGYVSDRFWMAAAMGCTIFKRSSPGFVTGQFVVYRDADELLSRAVSILPRPDGTRTGGSCTPACLNGESNGTHHTSRLPSVSSGFHPHEVRQWALSNHSIDQRCETLLECAATVAAAA